MTTEKKEVSVVRHDETSKKIIMRDDANGYTFKVYNDYLEKYCHIPDELRDNGLVRPGSKLKMVVRRNKEGKKRYALDRETYPAKVTHPSTTTPKQSTNEVRHMSLETLFEGTTLYNPLTADQMMALFLKRVAEGSMDKEVIQEVMTAMADNDDITVKAILKKALEIFDLGCQESKGIEFKASIYHLPKDHCGSLEEILRQITAMGNSDGGILYIGVSDHGEVVGIENEMTGECPFSTRERFEQDVLNRISQKTGSFNFANKIEFHWYRTKQKKVFLKITVPPSNDILLYGTELYVRSGTGMKKLGGKEHVEFILSKQINN